MQPTVSLGGVPDACLTMCLRQVANDSDGFKTLGNPFLLPLRSTPPKGPGAAISEAWRDENPTV